MKANEVWRVSSKVCRLQNGTTAETLLIFDAYDHRVASITVGVIPSARNVLAAILDARSELGPPAAVRLDTSE